MEGGLGGWSGRCDWDRVPEVRARADGELDDAKVVACHRDLTFPLLWGPAEGSDQRSDRL